MYGTSTSAISRESFNRGSANSSLKKQKLKKLKMMLLLWLVLLCSSVVSSDRSRFGVLLECEPDVSYCWWSSGGESGVGSRIRSDQLIAHYAQKHARVLSAQTQRNIEAHIGYLEEIHRQARLRNHTFSYDLGLTPFAHEDFDESIRQAADEVVQADMESMRQEKVLMRNHRELAEFPTSLNWCTEDNRLGKPICTTVKSQSKCGSCWAFAASDAIESAIAISTRGRNILSISPQQFLDCSVNGGSNRFYYGWHIMNRNLDRESPQFNWLLPEMNITSQNYGCRGGSAHLAFTYAAKHGVISELEYPYEDADSVNKTSEKGCRFLENKPYAFIKGWNSVTTNDQTQPFNHHLIRTLQQQPVSVTFHASDTFQRGYVGDIFTCATNITGFKSLNHAVVVVGYGHDEVKGLYWILKNSYGKEWGHEGFFYLKADNIMNCGLNVFPVVPVGASINRTQTVDGGGEIDFIGLSMEWWLVFASVLIIAVIIAAYVGYQKTNRWLRQKEAQSANT